MVDCELLVRNNFLYTIGGINEHGPITNIYRAPIDINGNIGLWVKVSELPIPIKHVKTFIFKNKLYVFEYTGMCSYKDQDRVICELRLKSNHSDYSEFYS